jgi:hypothetical protein
MVFRLAAFKRRDSGSNTVMEATPGEEFNPDDTRRACENFPKKPPVGALAWQTLVAKDRRQRLVLSQPVAEEVSARSRPDPQPKTLDHLRGFIGPIRSSQG